MSHQGSDSDDKAWLDARRSRRAILAVDLVESVRLMQIDEDGVINRWRRFVAEAMNDVVPARQGRVVKSLGDGMLLEFAEPRQAASAAFELNRRLATMNDAGRPELAMYLRQGANVSDVVIDDMDIYGQGVNLAARLGTLAHAGEIVVSDAFRDAVLPGVDAEVEDLGPCYLKHLDEPVRAFRVGPAMPTPPGLGASAGTDARVGVAVVPFRARVPGGGDQTLGDVLSDDLLGALSKVGALRVISRLSSAWFAQRGEGDDVAGTLLGVDYMVRGSYAVQGERLRLFISLRQSSSGEVIWSDEFDSSVGDVVAGEGEAVARVAAAVCDALVGFEVNRARGAPLHSLASYSILFAAISQMHRLTLRDFQAAGDMLRYVVARHPRATTPRAWLGKWHVLRVAQGYSDNPQRDAQMAHATLAEALDLDSRHSLALAVDGLASAYINRDLHTAGLRYEAALQANPNEGLALLFRSGWHAYQDQGAQAVACVERAQALSPLDPLKYYYDNFACMAYLAADNYGAAVEAGVRSLRANRCHASTLRALAIAQVLAGQVEEARTTVADLLRLEPGFTREAYLRRFPGQSGERTTRYADALTAAGLPG